MYFRATFSAIAVVTLTSALSPVNPLIQCNALQDLAAQAQLNFPVAPDTLRGAEQCSMSKSLTGGNTFHCAWSFDFRSDAAQAGFDITVATLESCFDNPPSAPKDQTVNHPDSYDLRQYNVDGVTISLSLKDKGALQKTYVFLGVGTR